MKYNLYKFYKEKYNLSTLDFMISNNKILALIVDEQNNYYFLDEKLITIKNSNLLEQIEFLNSTYNINITNFYPVCFCKDTLIIAFIIKSNNKNFLNIQNNPKDNSIKKLIKFYKKYYSNVISKDIESEIKMSQKYIKRYIFHEKIIKKYILTPKKRNKEELKKILNSMIPLKKSIIDISCGDNSDLFEVANYKKYDLIVGNDICLNYLKINNNMNKNIIYTNDDIRNANFCKKSFDVSFCKNTLHHLNSISEINNLFQFLDKISNEIIIVEVLDPKETGNLSKILNKYLYRKFLKDVGKNYLNEIQLKEIIKKFFINHDIEYTKFTNILGVYLIIKIKKEVSNENKC